MYSRREIISMGGILATGGCLASFRDPKASVGIENEASNSHRVRVEFRNAETDELVFVTEETVAPAERLYHEDVLDLPEAGLFLTTRVDGAVVDERDISNGFLDVHVIIDAKDEIRVGFTVA